MRRIRMSLFVAVAFSVYLSFESPSFVLGTERIWTEEEMRNGKPRICIVRDEWVIRYTDILTRMIIKYDNRIPLVLSASLPLDIDAIIKDLMKKFSLSALIVESESQCDNIWKIYHPVG